MYVVWTWYAMRVSSLCNCMVVAVAIPVCKKKRTDNALQSRRRRRRAASPPLQGLVNHDPFIEGVLSEGSEVMGHTPSWSRWKNNFLHHRSRHRSSSHWRSLAGLLAAPRASCAALMLRSTAQWVKNLDLVLNPFLISEKELSYRLSQRSCPKRWTP